MTIAPVPSASQLAPSQRLLRTVVAGLAAVAATQCGQIGAYNAALRELRRPR